MQTSSSNHTYPHALDSVNDDLWPFNFIIIIIIRNNNNNNNTNISSTNNNHLNFLLKENISLYCFYVNECLCVCVHMWCNLGLQRKINHVDYANTHDGPLLNPPSSPNRQEFKSPKCLNVKTDQQSLYCI